MLRNRAVECLQVESDPELGVLDGEARKAWLDGGTLLYRLFTAEKTWSDLPPDQNIGKKALSLVESIYGGVRKGLRFERPPEPQAATGNSPRSE